MHDCNEEQIVNAMGTLATEYSSNKGIKDSHHPDEVFQHEDSTS